MELLDIQPKQLPFVFELRKRLTCKLRLANNTGDYVAFKVLTTDPKKYWVQKSNGVIWPKSMCEVIVTMQVQRTAPPDMVCKDKFLIQSTVVPSWTVRENVTSNMFSREEGNYVEEEKLEVVYVSPQSPPMPINAAFKEGLFHKPPKPTHQIIVQLDQATPMFKHRNAAFRERVPRPFPLKLKIE